MVWAKVSQTFMFPPISWEILMVRFWFAGVWDFAFLTSSQVRLTVHFENHWIRVKSFPSWEWWRQRWGLEAQSWLSPHFRLGILGSGLLTNGANVLPGPRMGTKMEAMVLWKWKGKQWHLLKSEFLPLKIILRTLCYMDNYLLSTDEESETQRLNNFSGNIQLASGEQGGNLECLTIALILLPL